MERQISRRSFLKKSAIALGIVAVCDLKGIGGAVSARPNKSQVFFTKDIDVNGLLKIYSKINQGMTGKIGIKLHSGEPHGPNLLPIEFIKACSRIFRIAPSWNATFSIQVRGKPQKGIWRL